MKREEFEFLLQQGEGLKLEFKENFDAKNIAKEMVAFANTEGGRMKNAMKEAGLPEPEFEFTNFFTIKFKRHFLVSKEQETPQKTVEKILNILRENPTVTIKKLQELTGLTRRGVEWNLAKLKQEGRIKRIGPNRGGHWDVEER